MRTGQIDEETRPSIAIEHNSGDAPFGSEVQKPLLSGCWECVLAEYHAVRALFSSEKAFACCSWQHSTGLDRSLPTITVFYIMSLDAVTSVLSWYDAYDATLKFQSRHLWLFSFLPT